MRLVAGFSQKSGQYYLSRATVQPPRSLTKRIWPWVDAGLAYYRAIDHSKLDDFTQDCLDASARQFLELMEWLRIILLQDAAILQKSCPGLPLWQHEVFSLPDWNVFATDVMSVHIRAEMPKDMLLTVTMPRVAEAIDENRQAFMKMFE